MTNNKQIKDLSYFRLSLLSHLMESFPERLDDVHFVISRSEQATEIYSDSLKNGLSEEQASELSNKALYWGLHFSKHDTIVNVLWNEFSEEVGQGEAKEFAKKLLPECESVFGKYDLTDDFAYTSDYDLLYTELIGTIVIWLEDNSYDLQ